MQIDLQGKVAIVTGAGRGIGREIATVFAKEGARLVPTDVNSETLDDLARQLRAAGQECLPCRCDVRDDAQIQATIQQVIATYGRIDILVNNAGVLRTGMVETFSEADWDLSHDVNLKGIFLMCRAVIPAMKRQRAGRILNAASFAAIVPSVGSACYAAMKSGVVFFTRALAGELGPWNITVNCYAPGMIPTEMNHFADAPPEQQTRLLDTLTLRRWGEPQDIAQLLCFLASEQAGYITGALIDISGGKLATQIPRAAYEYAARQGEISLE